MSRPHKNTILGKRDGVLILGLLEQDKMPEEFYDVLNGKMSRNDQTIRGFAKYVEKNNTQKWCSMTEEMKRKLVNRYFIDMLEKSSSGITKLCRICDFSNNLINLIKSLDQNHYSIPDSFVVFGCPESTDIDVTCFVRKEDNHMGKTKELSSESIQCIRLKLQDLGYDTENREIDINTVYVDPDTQMITGSSKGGVETQNIINATHMYHKQVMDEQTLIPRALHLHPMKNIEFTDEVIFEKLRAFAKFVLDYAEDLMTPRDYQSFRPIKMELYKQGGDQMIRYMQHILKHITLDPIKALAHHINMTKYHDRFKSMVMKLLQILLYSRCKETIYVKIQLADSIHRIVDVTKESKDHIEIYESGALWCMFRGNRGRHCPELFPLLLRLYDQTANHFLNKYVVEPLIFSREHVCSIQEKYHVVQGFDHGLLESFISSPEFYTDEFEAQWVEKHGLSSDVNRHFIIPCSDQKEFYRTYSALDQEVIDLFNQSFIFVDQRSPEWISMIKHRFVCGSSSGSIDNTTFQGSYNLIRGAVLELLAIHLFDPSSAGLPGFSKWFLGFIVEHDIKGSRGFAPDMVLISADSGDQIPEIIVVEIKGLKHNRKNADYYRGLHLATKQIRSAQDILSPKGISRDKLKITRGLILLCCIQDKELKMEIHHVDL
jgi:hypothetical protein